MEERGITVGDICGVDDHMRWMRGAMSSPQLCPSYQSITLNIKKLHQLVSTNGFSLETPVRTLHGLIETNHCPLCLIFLGKVLLSIKDQKMFNCLFNDFLVIYGDATAKINLEVRLKSDESTNSLPDLHELLVHGTIVGDGLLAESFMETHIRFKVYALPDDPVASFISSRDYDHGMGSIDAYSQIRSWISNCNKNHLKCRSLEPTSLPTRILDLFTQDDSDDLKLLLTHGEYGYYVALSYCWGSSQQVRTTTSSLNEMCTHIAKSSLPLTIQDAITVTRQIGIRYLWVDALCIIQDSAEDKAIEISRMAMIYRQSYVTISAANARNAHEGFLATKPTPRGLELPADEFRFRLPVPSPDGVLGGITVEYDLWERDISPEPLDHRAWALQERILSPRILKYGTSTLSWCCEQDVLGWTSWLRSHQKVSHKIRIKGDEELFKTTWKNIVVLYSNCQLSFAEDKLLAIAGLAAEVISKSKPGSSPGMYLAGIWGNDLLNQLLWFTSLEKSGNVRDFSYRAPSWSWASVESRIIFSYPNPTESDETCQEMLEVIGFHCEPLSGLSPFGPVSGGALRVRGRLVPGSSIPEPWNWSPGIFQTPTPAVVLQLDDFCSGDKSAVARAQSAWWLHIQHRYGFVLEKISDKSYRRIGLVYQKWWLSIGEWTTLEVL